MSMTASAMIEAWVAHHGKPIPWAKAVEIVWMIDHLGLDEKHRLLALGEAPSSAAPEPQMSLPLIPEPSPPEPVDDPGAIGAGCEAGEVR